MNISAIHKSILETLEYEGGWSHRTSFEMAFSTSALIAAKKAGHIQYGKRNGTSAVILTDAGRQALGINTGKNK